MEKDILVILMIAFGLFAILMFILFYIYAKKHYNDKHINEDYEEISNEELELVEIIINNKNYVFDANGYDVSEGEKVRVILNGKIVNGRVIKANYTENLNKLIERPEKLVLSNEVEETKTFSDDMDFVPRKKK